MIPALKKIGMDLEYTDEEVVKTNYLQFFVDMQSGSVRYSPRKKLCWIRYDTRFARVYFIKLALGMACMIYDCSSDGNTLVDGFDYTFSIWQQRGWPTTVVRAAIWHMLCKRMPGTGVLKMLSKIMTRWYRLKRGLMS